MTDSFSSGDSDKILDEAGKNALYKNIFDSIDILFMWLLELLSYHL